MIYKFAQVYYLFVVKKVDTIEATGYRKAARLLKVVFEAYRRDDKGDPLRCDEERIAQHFYQVFSNGCWHTVEHHDDRAFLEALGLKPDLESSAGSRDNFNRSVDRGPPRLSRPIADSVLSRNSRQFNPRCRRRSTPPHQPQQLHGLRQFHWRIRQLPLSAPAGRALLGL